MSSPFGERITLAHFLAPMSALAECEDPVLAAELEGAARRFCAALADHRGSGDYRVRLRPPVDLGADALARRLLQASDVLRQGSELHAAMGAWCCALAARLGAVLGEADPATARVLVFVEVDQYGVGELWLTPYDASGAVARFDPNDGG